MFRMLVFLLAAPLPAFSGGSDMSELDSSLQIRVADDRPIPFPVSRFSVRQGRLLDTGQTPHDLP